MTTLYRRRHESSLCYVLRTSAPFISGVLVCAGLAILIGAALFGNP